MKVKAKIMDEQGVNRSITRISHEILEKNKGTQDLVVIGIKTRGVYLANRIAQKIFEIEKKEINIDTIDISMYRDDLEKISNNPVVNKSDLKTDINNKVIVLIDDVIYTGRTVRAALDAIIDAGRPSSIFLGVLIARGHRELPIKADFVGKNVPTSKSEIVQVHLKEVDAVDEVLIVENV